MRGKASMSSGQEASIFLRQAPAEKIRRDFAIMVFRILAVVAASSVLSPSWGEAFWPFGKEEPYMAKVGGKVITVKEFIEQIGKLHTSDRVGEALSKEKTFE